MKESSNSRRSKTSKGSKSSKTSFETLRRKLNLWWIQIGLYDDRKKQIQLLGVILLFNLCLLFFGMSSSNVQLKTETISLGSQEPDTATAGPKDLYEAVTAQVGGFGTPVKNEPNVLKHSGLKSVVFTSSDDKSAELRNIEVLMNQGWNATVLKVQPLGQLGYVKRDLPVYKDGFSKLDRVDILERPKSGLFSVEELKKSTYNSILCLSFNTDHCFDPNEYAALGPSRKVNRILGLRDVVWSKHKFCKTIASATRGITDSQLLSFTFPCWIMPGDYDKMLADSITFNVERWIAKPRSLGAGMGIYVVDTKDKLRHEQNTKNVVQSYLENPHLIEKIGLNGNMNKFKWDLRTYVLCTSVHPIRAYVYSRGLVRISTSPYSKDCSNITACLTNTSLNKKVEGAQLKDITWSLKKLREYLAEKGNNEWDEIMLKIQQAIGMTLLSSETEFLRNMNPKGYTCENCYQLLGVDVLLDDHLVPKIVEINGEPSLKLTGNGKTHYDFTKRNMARDLVEIVFNRKSKHSKVANSLRQWAGVTGKAENINPSFEIGEDHLKYILSTAREQSDMGGFLPVYPNEKLATIYGRYLKELSNREAVEAVKKPDVLYAHADGRRFRIHQIVTAMQQLEKYPEDVSEASASPRKQTNKKVNLRHSYNKEDLF